MLKVTLINFFPPSFMFISDLSPILLIASFSGPFSLDVVLLLKRFVIVP